MSEYSREDVLKLIEENDGPESLDLAGRDLSHIDLGRDRYLTRQEESIRSWAKPAWLCRDLGHYIDLRGANLRRATLTGANLTEVHLGGADLRDADLIFATLRRCCLVQANLQGANLTGANLRGADLEAANLQGACLAKAHLGSARLARADLRMAVLDGARLQFSDLEAADLQGASLADAYLRAAKLQEANLTNANFKGAIGFSGELQQSRDTNPTVSSEIACELRAQGVPIAPIVRIPLGVDCERFSPLASDQKGHLRLWLGLPKSGTLVVCAARLLRRQKGLDILLAAWRRVVSDVGNSYLVLLGDGPDRSKLESEATELGLAERVVFVGWHKNPESYLAACDLFALASRSEGLSNALLEAMACGLPVVATQVSGSVDVVNDQVGYLVPVEDVEALADRLCYLLKSPDLRRRMGANARRLIRTRYSMDMKDLNNLVVGTVLEEAPNYLFPSPGESARHIQVYLNAPWTSRYRNFHPQLRFADRERDAMPVWYIVARQDRKFEVKAVRDWDGQTGAFGLPKFKYPLMCVKDEVLVAAWAIVYDKQLPGFLCFGWDPTDFENLAKITKATPDELMKLARLGPTAADYGWRWERHDRDADVRLECEELWTMRRAVGLSEAKLRAAVRTLFDRCQPLLLVGPAGAEYEAQEYTSIREGERRLGKKVGEVRIRPTGEPQPRKLPAPKAPGCLLGLITLLSTVRT